VVDPIAGHGRFFGVPKLDWILPSSRASLNLAQLDGEIRHLPSLFFLASAICRR
jgi:hypothetical protein